jgi:serine/threonine protein kinase
MGRFRLVRPLARGGLGEVIVAVDTELGREVALKRILRDYVNHPDARARFVREAEITAALEHPGVVPVYGFGASVGGQPFYAMRFITGRPMREAVSELHRKGPPDFEGPAFRQLLQRLVSVCQTMAYGHSRGVIHRDLKPANVMLGEFGETLVVDWGLAKAAGKADPDTAFLTQVTQEGVPLGSPGYMSPEQIDGRAGPVGPATDIYSLGAMLYSLLTGKAPLKGLSQNEVMEATLAGRVPRPRKLVPSAPAALEAVCRKAMARRAADRYASAADLAADLERWLADEPVTAMRERLSARLGR